MKIPRITSRFAATASLLIVILLGSCSQARPEPQAQDVGYNLYTHCGAAELTYNNAWYVKTEGSIDTDPRSIWADPYQHGSLRIDGDRAVFVHPDGPELIYQLRPGASEPLTVCS